MFSIQYFVNILNEIAFTQHPLENPIINSFIHWEKFSLEKCFLEFADSTSIWRIRFHGKFIYAPTAKTSPGNLLCYLLRTWFVSGWVSVLFHYSFCGKYSSNIKSVEKYTSLTNWMSLLYEYETRKHSTKIFHEIIIFKLQDNRCNWLANP